MSDGTLSIRRRRPKTSENRDDAPFSANALRAGTYETFLGGTLPSIGQGKVRSKVRSKAIGDVDELRIETKRKKRLREYDRLLKGFKYSAALDSVLRKVKCQIQF
jgi:U3 small nucleolar RNA-associated protein 15